MSGILFRDPLRGLLSAAPINGVLGSGLSLGGQGLAPFGLRHSGLAPKGLGFFGAVPSPRHGGFSTELSAEFDIGGRNVEAPLMVPTLTATELTGLLSGERPSESVYQKARAFAEDRLKRGLSPFIGPSELRYPLPR